jgi:hypothetical protein
MYIRKQVLNFEKQLGIVTQIKVNKLNEYLDELEFWLYRRWPSGETLFAKKWNDLILKLL